MTSPNEEKFRILKKTNKAIQQKLLSVRGRMHDLILALGYVDLDDDMYTFVGDYFKVLVRAKAVIAAKYGPVKYQHLSPEEKARHDENERKKQEYEAQRRKFQEEKRKKDEYMRQLKESQQNDRKEVGQKEIKASHANQLKFGANLIAF